MFYDVVDVIIDIICEEVIKGLGKKRLFQNYF